MTHEVHLGDCLELMQQVNSDSIDLIITDPPFAKGRVFTDEAGEFTDYWEWADHGEGYEPPEQFAHAWSVVQQARQHYSENLASFLAFLFPRLLEMHRILRPTGSLYLHCDETAKGFIRLMLEMIFGPRNFRNELVWCYDKGRASTKCWKRNHDTIFFLTKSNCYPFKALRVPTKDGKFELRRPFTRNGGPKWEPKEPGKQAASWWADIPSFGTATGSRERVGYPTQKPVALAIRMIEASSEPDDMVLDPFMGSGTTLIAARQLGRNCWGMDTSPKAVEAAWLRLAHTEECIL